MSGGNVGNVLAKLLKSLGGNVGGNGGNSMAKLLKTLGGNVGGNVPPYRGFSLEAENTPSEARASTIDTSLADAVLLWNAGWNGQAPAFAVRALGHRDYDLYDFQNGACLQSWREMAKRDPQRLALKFIVELWHIAAFYEVPIDRMKPELLRIPEYRRMLADDCLRGDYPGLDHLE